MTSPGARSFRRQMAHARQPDGGVDLDRLGQLVISTDGESEADQRRTRRAAEVMAAELEEVNAALEQTVYSGFVEIRVYAPRVGVAAGAKPKRYPDF